MPLSFRNFLFYPYVSEIFSSYPSSLPSFPSILLFFLFFLCVLLFLCFFFLLFVSSCFPSLCVCSIFFFFRGHLWPFPSVSSPSVRPNLSVVGSAAVSFRTIVELRPSLGDHLCTASGASGPPCGLCHRRSSFVRSIGCRRAGSWLTLLS